MSKILILLMGIFVLFLLFLTIFKVRIRRRKISIKSFTKKWDRILKNLSDSNKWYSSVLDADDMLDDVLKRKKYSGKSTGERLVSAQHELSENEMVWYSHKLKTKILEQDYKKINKTETINALNGFKSALTDLGALRASEKKPKAKKIRKSSRKKK